MLGHIAVPALDPTRRPGHAVRAHGADLLRRDLGFRGLIVTDAHGDGRACGRPGRARPRCARCRPAPTSSCCRPSPRSPSQALVRAVREGQLTRGAHRRLGAAHPGGQGAARPAPATAAWTPPRSRGSVGRPEDVDARARGGARARSPSCATRAACCRCAPRSRCASCTSCCRATRATTPIQGIPEDELAARRDPDARRCAWGPEVSEETAPRIVAAAPRVHPRAGLGFVRVAALQGHGGHVREPRAPAAGAARRRAGR